MKNNFGLIGLGLVILIVIFNTYFNPFRVKRIEERIIEGVKGRVVSYSIPKGQKIFKMRIENGSIIYAPTTTRFTNLAEVGDSVVKLPNQNLCLLIKKEALCEKLWVEL